MITDYIIQKIQHSGRKGIRNTDCTDLKYDGLIGYKCHIDVDEIQQFKSYEFKVDSPKYESWRTSEVLTAGVFSIKNVIYLEIETVNTIYLFERIKNET